MQQLQRKYIKQGKEIRKNQTAAENFDIYTCLIFGRYYHQRFFFFLEGRLGSRLQPFVRYFQMLSIVLSLK